MTLKQKYKELRKNGSALVAANIYNFETINGIVQAAKKEEVPVILQTSIRTIDYLGVKVTANLAKTVLEQNDVQGWVHLDHTDSFDLIKECLDAGFDSVMIDASDKPLDENIAITKRVVDLAAKYDASVEAELGHVADPGDDAADSTFYTKPNEAKKFVESTGINALAVAVGSAHGFYETEPQLNMELLKKIHQSTECALVLHGGSGIPAPQIQESIRNGVRKFNLATEFKSAFMKSLKKEIKTSSNLDIRKVFRNPTHKITDIVSQKMKIIKEVQ